MREVPLEVGLLLYTATLREQVRLAETGQAASGEYRALADRGRVVGTALAVLVVVIVFLMVVKPVLW